MAHETLIANGFMLVIPFDAQVQEIFQVKTRNNKWDFPLYGCFVALAKQLMFATRVCR
jgi:hypothetical protein